jgi:hypothetical protein
MNIFLKENSSFDLSLISKPPKKISIANFDGENDGRFDIDFENYELECFFKKSHQKLLLVFFSAAGRNDGKTVFHRVSWCEKIDANMLFIEDPMYKKHGGLTCGWYYGDGEESYLEKISKFVDDFSSKINVLRSNVVFVGSSSAAYAALFCANQLGGSKAYAYNPQLNLNDWPDARNFTKITGIDISTQDVFLRNNIHHIKNNKESRFFVYYNPASSHDGVQINPLIKALNVDSSDGLHAVGGVYLAIKKVDAHNPHLCVADINDFFVALKLLYDEEGSGIDYFNAYLNKFAIAATKDEEAFYSKIWYDFLKNGFPSILRRPKEISKYYIDFDVDDAHKIFRYRVSHQRMTKKSEVVFYIMKGPITFNDGFVSQIKDLATSKNLKININIKAGFIRIWRDFNSFDSAYFEIINLINDTYRKSLSIYEKYK